MYGSKVIMREKKVYIKTKEIWESFVNSWRVRIGIVTQGWFPKITARWRVQFRALLRVSMDALACYNFR